MKRDSARALILVSIGVFIAAFALIGCQEKTNEPSGPPEKITLAYTTIPNAALVQVALKKGYFTTEGLAVSPQRHLFGKAAVDSLLEGKADLATAAETPFVFAVMKGAKIFVLASIETATKNEAIMARIDRGIKNPQDLKGKRIGVTPGTGGEFFLASFLTINGLEGKDIRAVDMPPEAMVEALLTGRVDAVACWNPNLVTLRKELGGRGIIFYAESAYTETFLLAGNQDFVRKNPGAIGKVLKALVRAETFVREDPIAARAIVTEETGMDAALLAEIWPVFDYRVRLEQSLLLTLEDVSRWAIRNGHVKQRKVPNYLDYIYLDGLTAVKPEDLRVIR
jgi:ABC-type nitrate/sulfonate/bicarbonate transport system substrate-binding protein